MEEMTFGFSPARTTTPGPRKKKFPFGVLVGGGAYQRCNSHNASQHGSSDGYQVIIQNLESPQFFYSVTLLGQKPGS